jgi:hypothetical protein
MFPNRSSVFYAILTVLGLVLTWTFNLQHFAGGGTTADFFTMGFVNPVASSLTVDLLVGCAAFMTWAVIEARRRGMKHAWVYVVLTFGVAFAFAGPLFLWMRERHIAAEA